MIPGVAAGVLSKFGLSGFLGVRVRALGGKATKKV